MTIVSVKSETSEEHRRIELSDGSVFSFKTCYLPYIPDIAEGREISGDEEASFRFASACLRAETTALKLIARAEQNVYGLSLKLEKRGHDSACVRSALARLCELGVLSDLRYARLWLESRVSRGSSSPRRLRAALRARNIDRHDAETALKEVLDDETEQMLLEHFAQKMQNKSAARSREDAPDYSLKYLLRNEGFSSQAIERYLDTI